MHNFLITGGAGFIGANFVHYLLDKHPDYRLVVYDKLTYAGNLSNLADVSDDPRYVFAKRLRDAALLPYDYSRENYSAPPSRRRSGLPPSRP